jgi:hypothetical protein
MKIGLMLPLGEDDGSAGRSAGPSCGPGARGRGVRPDSVWGADHLVFRDEAEFHGIHEIWTVLPPSRR